MDLITLEKEARIFGLHLSPEQLSALQVYARELEDWNTRVNLTAITAPDQIMVKHFLDSLSVASVLDAKPSNALIDIGTGAGFPGLVLKIAVPDLRVTLVEATGKKVDFLKAMIAELHLQKVEAIQARAEDLARDPRHRERYDFAVARAVADLAILLEYALPFVRTGGLFVAQKGIRVDEEIQAAGRSLETLGGRLRESVPVRLPGLEPRHLILVDKISPTPAAYPRRAGIPERKPIR